MIDQKHLRSVADRAAEGLPGFHIQSYMVLMAHGRPDGLRHRASSSYFRRGWFNPSEADHGAETANQSDHEGVSLYLSPTGMPFFVAYSNHCNLTWDIMGLNQSQMDDAGWLHISGGRIDPQCLITPAQKAWIEDSGYTFRWNTHSPPNWETKQPVPYPEADKFNVRPTEDEDRFHARLYRQGLNGTLRPAYTDNSL